MDGTPPAEVPGKLEMERTEWALGDVHDVVSATIPPNTTASVSLPGAEAFEVGPGIYQWTEEQVSDSAPLVAATT